jgi:hypothetical protein
MAIGLLVGLALAGAAVLWPGLFAQRLKPEEFERAVTSEPIDGNPVARNVTAHVRSGYRFVTLDWLRPQNGNAAASDAVAYHYVSARLDPENPYVPRDAPSQIVDLRINPGASAGNEEGGDPNRVPLFRDGSPVQQWSSLLALQGWTPHDGGASASPDDGATAAIAMRYGDYDLLVQIDTSQAEMALKDHLSIGMNDKPLPPLARTDDLSVWKTHVTKEAFRINERQVLRFAVKNGTLKVRQIRFFDPNYTILDYLAYVKGKYPDFDYEVGWLDNPTVAFPMFGGAGLFLIGIMIPLAVRVIARTRELLMLAKARRMSAMSSLVPGSPKLTIEDWFQLVDLIAALETSLREVLIGQRVLSGALGAARQESHPADSFVQRAPDEPVAVVEEDHDKAFGCKKDDVYPTELGAAVGQVLFTSEDARELNDIRRAARRKKNAKK